VASQAGHQSPAPLRAEAYDQSPSWMPVTEPHPAPAREAGNNGAGLVVTNLLNDLATLGSLLDDAARRDAWLDAYLVAAGINQIAEDYLHSSPYPLDEAASLLGKTDSPYGRLAGRAAAAGGWVARRLAARTAGLRATLVWQRQVAVLVADLADAAIIGAARDPGLRIRCAEIARQVESLPAGLQRTIVRLPACFHDFDQRPEDLARLAARFSERWPERTRPLTVVGVRTSGSYLAPLIAAWLRAIGYHGASALTLRPGRALLADECALLRLAGCADALVLLTDDPPVTGASLAHAATQLERLGVAQEAVVLMLALEDEPDRLPPPLAGYASVVIGPEEWSVHSRLKAGTVRREVAALLAHEFEVEAVDQLPVAVRRRGHRRALFRLRGYDIGDGAARELDVLASGVGLGYFGAHVLDVARTLGAFSPRVLGLRDGVLYREWLPAERSMAASGSDGDALAAGAASYVAARRRALGVARDASVAMRGERAVWEIAGLILSGGFFRLAPVARVTLVDRVARRLLRVAEPSVVDGSMTPEHWFAPIEDSRPPVKVGLSDRSYWRLGLTCFDATFDLAGVGALAPDGALADNVRLAWRRKTGEEIDSERWLLYELAHLWGRLRARPEEEAEVRHASARAVQRYFAGAFLEDVKRKATGALCALDIDGVLETDHLGFPSPTRASATALRALIAHGYRPVPITGRGLGEVRDRCRSYGLAGGVAEYGSVVCLEGGDRSVALVGPDGAAALRRLRATLSARGGILLDPAYAHAVRAYRVSNGGRRLPLGAVEVTECLEASGATDAVRAIPGESQTDFVAVELDKGEGLRVLAAELAGDTEQIALAVGDTAADAPMLALARAAFVPAHAAAEATTTGARRVGRPYQAGLALAVAELLGHRPGGCELCRVARTTPSRELLLELLSIPESGRRGVAWRTLRLALRHR
jgi:hypothetical protein